MLVGAGGDVKDLTMTAPCEFNPIRSDRSSSVCCEGVKSGPNPDREARTRGSLPIRLNRVIVPLGWIAGKARVHIRRDCEIDQVDSRAAGFCLRGFSKAEAIGSGLETPAALSARATWRSGYRWRTTEDDSSVTADDYHVLA